MGVLTGHWKVDARIESGTSKEIGTCFGGVVLVGALCRSSVLSGHRPRLRPLPVVETTGFDPSSRQDGEGWGG